MTYEMDVAGLKRELPLCKVSDDLYIGAFVMFGDVELTVHCAAELLKRAPEYDYLIAPEAKAIPLLYEMARQSGADKYFLARKGPKAYMSGVFEVDVKSITTMSVQKLVIDTADAELIKGKPVEEALELSNQAVVEALDGLPPQKIHCSVLAEEAVRAAVKDYYDKNGIAYDPEKFQIHDCEHCHDLAAAPIKQFPRLL